MFLPRKILEDKLLAMLAEDLGQGDVTTTLIVPPESTAEATVISRETGVVAGIEEAQILFQSLGLTVKPLVEDGQQVEPNQALIRVSGNARTILSAERTVLNMISHMSGIATKTRQLVTILKKAKFRTRIACTRKTAPGLLYFDKKAAYIGGADTHRLHLDDMILVKDNHIKVAGNIRDAVRIARERGSFSKKIEAEATTVADALEAAEAGADVVMLDNFSSKQVMEAVEAFKQAGFFGKVLLEVSGGVTDHNLLKYAAAQVDIMSMGALTHDVEAMDVSLEVSQVK